MYNIVRTKAGRVPQAMHIHMGENFQEYSLIQDFEADFPQKVQCCQDTKWSQFNKLCKCCLIHVQYCQNTMKSHFTSYTYLSAVNFYVQHCQDTNWSRSTAKI